ncbi:cytochrome P450 [Streptomyces platensis]|uniref:cytochrome P450 n=1 Tax=Streptomyces platensis TaxID=58346 RepID=UPI001F1B4C0C|nr:cytochrome P450 [Streptomyces platensis]MCF3142686.1 cytochrome P450 [Streptomyces platensis]
MSPNEQILPYPLSYETALDPPAEWAELRSKCPVVTVTVPDGSQAKLLTRYDDVKEMLADPRFTRPDLIGESGNSAEASATSAAENTTASPFSVPKHGEEHQRWRRMVGKWFTAKRMAALRPQMAAIADQLLDEMTGRGNSGDLKAHLAFPLPVYVICDMLGVPAEDRHLFSYWSDNFLNLTRYSAQERQAAVGEFAAYMAGHIAAKRSEPADDLLSTLIEERSDEGPALTDAELLGTGMGLLVAGHETTANMIGKTVAMLLADRTRWERLLENPSLVRSTVEEALRFDVNGGFGLRRHLTEDVEIGGEVLSEGTTVVCAMAAANRDETAFANAAEMDLARTPNPHLAFGAGPHSCLGQALARTELQVTLEVLLRRLPSLELDVPATDLERLEGLLVGGLSEVPVRW